MIQASAGRPTKAELEKWREQTRHPFFAIGLTTLLDRLLKVLLSTCMPNLSNRLRDKLFTGYGPLQSFSAKIDIAFAMGLISPALRRDLHVFREIRNEFAHPMEMVHFDADNVKKILEKFPDYNPKKEITEEDRILYLVVKNVACFDEIHSKIDELREIKKPKLKKSDTPPGKSA